MERFTRGSKTFYSIPENGTTKGVMPTKWLEEDLDAGIKEEYKQIIREAMFYASNETIRMPLYTAYDGDPVEAYAYCDERDEWDAKTGIEVCANKMELKNHLKLTKKYEKILQMLHETELVVEDLLLKHETKAMAIEQDLCNFYGRLEV